MQRQDLVRQYQTGATVKELAERFGINRNTVSAHLDKDGVAKRHRGLNEEQGRLAARLYEQGQSLACIGLRFGVAADTVRAALLARDIPMRDPQGGRRPA